jgi:hypothetical protein
MTRGPEPHVRGCAAAFDGDEEVHYRRRWRAPHAAVHLLRTLLGLCFVAEGLIERSDPRMKLFAQDSRRCLFAELRHYKPT